MARQYPGIYRYQTKQGPRYRYNFRDSDGRQSCKRGFLSPQAAAADKAGLDVQAAAGTLHSLIEPALWPAPTNGERRRLAKQTSADRQAPVEVSRGARQSRLDEALLTHRRSA